MGVLKLLGILIVLGGLGYVTYLLYLAMGPEWFTVILFFGLGTIVLLYLTKKEGEQ